MGYKYKEGAGGGVKINSNQAVQNISLLNLQQRESLSSNAEIFHVAYYNVITPDLAFVMTGFLPVGEFRASALYSAGKTGGGGGATHNPACTGP